MKSKVKPGNVGVMTNSDNGRLFQVDSVVNGLVYCRSIEGPLVFKTCFPWQFWALLDSF